MRFLLDTNVLSEVTRKRPAPTVLRRLAASRPGDLATSVVCVMELRYGAVRHPSGRELWDRISREVLSLVRRLPVDETVALQAGEFLAALDAQGTPVGIEDVLIGATAAAHRLTLVTRNLRHFERLPGVAVESWWE